MALRLRGLNRAIINSRNFIQNIISHKSFLSCLIPFEPKMEKYFFVFNNNSTSEDDDDKYSKTSDSSDCGSQKMPYLMAYLAALFATKKKDRSQWECEKELVHKIAMAEIALNDGDVEKARRILETALQSANEKDVKVGVPCLYDMLATIAYKQGEIVTAEKLLIEIIERLISAGISETDNQVVNFSMKLCRVYCNLKQDELAEMGFKNCLSVQKQKVTHGIKDEETGMLWISILFWYGKFLMARNRNDEAKTYFETAYAASAQVKSVMPTQIMVILYYLSEISMSKHDYDGALKHLLNAVILGKGTNNSDLPLYYVKIGVTYLHKGIYDQAKVWCDKGRKASKSLRNKETEVEAIGCLEKLKTISFA